MELHSHKETLEHVSVTHPILGLILFWGGSALCFVALSFEQTLNDINLLLAIVLKLFSIASIIISVIIYWDKISVNFKQMQLDFKEKFQRKK